MSASDDDLLTPDDQAAADAVLQALEAGASAGPEVEAVSDAWLAVVVLERPGPAPAELASATDESEQLGLGRHAFALALAVDAAGRPEAEAVRRLAAVAADAVSAGGRAAMVVGRGARGRNAVLGPALDDAATLFRRLVGEGVQGLVLDARAHALVGRPAEPVAGGFRPARPRPTRRWWLAGGLAAAAAALLFLVPALRPAGDAPPAFIYIAGERTPTNTVRGPEAPTFREGDALDVTVEAPAGGYVSLILLDSRDRLVMTVPPRLNFEGSMLRERFELDDQPGREQFLAVVSRRPVPDLVGSLDAINRRADLDRGQRVAQLRDALSAQLPPGAFTLVTTTEILHAP